jgi:hypothetical protein
MNRTRMRLVAIAAAGSAVLILRPNREAVAACTHYKVDGFTAIDTAYWQVNQSSPGGLSGTGGEHEGA